ncbi:MAG: DUF3794 domain-containing protein [Oscillospiraceae bacterium]|nr:DUF3794 domain-containing protein [Oscillospiraceae bacterium]
MDLQFSQSVFQCLQPATREYQTQEQTQDVRIPEGMPDIGTVLASWGQVILRGKEWRSDQVGISGGVLARVLYLPEGGDTPHSVEAWLPFQMKWTIPGGCQDGTIVVQPCLRSADARSLSARKLMVRVNVGILMEAYCPAEHVAYRAESIPEDVQVLEKCHHLTVAKEAGEKAFNLDEHLEMPGQESAPEQILKVGLTPQVLEQKVLSDKLVFRGLCVAHVLYRGTDGQLYSRDFDLPFSQYAELVGEYSAEAYPTVIPVVTNLELESTPEGAMRLKGGLSGQYIIYDKSEVILAGDAFSPLRKTELTMDQFCAPSVDEQILRTVSAQTEVQTDVMRPIDVVFWPEQPYAGRENDRIEADLSGIFQILYYDPDGQLQSMQSRWQETVPFPAEKEQHAAVSVRPGGKPQFSAGMLCADLLLDCCMTSGQGLPMVTAMGATEAAEPDPRRPSLVVTKVGNNTLWDLAKENGSTVEKINRANGLQAEPTPDQVLLIPLI